jgi:branched-subunit amino acid transport protein
MTAWVTVALAGIGTYFIRLSGIALLRDPERLPVVFRRALRMIAPAAMGAIVCNALFLEDGGWRALGAWHIAAVAGLAAAWWRRSMGWSLGVGLAAFAILRAWGL